MPAPSRTGRPRALSADPGRPQAKALFLMADVGTRGALTLPASQAALQLAPWRFVAAPYATPSGPLGRHHPQRAAATALSSRVDSDYAALLQQRAESAGIGVCAARTRRFSPLASAKFVACTPEEAGLDLSLEDLEQMRLTFAANDLNKDGVIDLPEFEQMMARLARQKGKRYSKAQVSLPSLFASSEGMRPSPPTITGAVQVHALFHRADIDRSGALDFNEFLRLQRRQAERRRSHKVRALLWPIRPPTAARTPSPSDRHPSHCPSRPNVDFHEKPLIQP